MRPNGLHTPSYDDDLPFGMCLVPLAKGYFAVYRAHGTMVPLYNDGRNSRNTKYLFG